MSKELQHFEKEICDKIKKSDVKDVMTRYDLHAITFIFFIENFQILDELDKRILDGYVLNIYSVDEKTYCCHLSYHYTSRFENVISNMYLEDIKFG